LTGLKKKGQLEWNLINGHKAVFNLALRIDQKVQPIKRKASLGLAFLSKAIKA